MGQRWEKRFENLNFFNPNKTEVKDYEWWWQWWQWYFLKVYTSYKQRCIESGKEFINGLFSTELPLVEDNHLLRLHNIFFREIFNKKKIYTNNLSNSENDFRKIVYLLQISTQVTILRKIRENSQKSFTGKPGKNVDRNWRLSREFPGKDSPLRNSCDEHRTVAGVLSGLEIFLWLFPRNISDPILRNFF